MKKSKFGFSLIELSVVILIIGILVIGISKSSRIVSESKIKAAKQFTNSSPIASMPDLVLWLETSDLANIGTNTVASPTYTGSPSDGDLVAAWKDRNPQADQKLLIASSDGTRPTYVKNGIGGLPSLSFNGSNTGMTLGGIGAITSGRTDYTTIIVFKMTGSDNVWILSQGGGCNGDSASINLYNGGSVSYIGCGLGGIADANSGGSLTTKLNMPYYLIIRVNKNLPTNIMSFYLNRLSSTANPNPGNPIGSSMFYLGNRFSGSNFYQGLISEVIIFNRALTNNEVTAVQDYLAKKYSIK